MMQNAEKKPGTVRKVLRYIGKYKALLLLSLVLALISVGMTLAIPLLVGRAIDTMIGEGQVDFDILIRYLFLMGILISLTALFQWLMNAINNRLTYATVRDLRRDAFNRLQKVPLSYLDTHRTGDIVSRVIGDADVLADGLLLGFTQLFTGVVTVLGTLLFMAFTHWVMALLVALLTPLSFFAAKFISKRTYHFSMKQSRDRGDTAAYMEETVSGIKTVKSFSREREAGEKFDVLNRKLEKSSLYAVFFSSLTNPVTRFVNNLVYAAVAFTGALLTVFQPQIPGAALFSVGKLSSFLAYSNQYTKPFNEISGVLAELQHARAAAERLLELIAVPVETEETENVLGEAEGEVELSHVDFSYTPENPLIQDFSFRVKPGMHVAIVGPTGCGKTTLINLLLRFYSPLSGKITVDGKNIEDVTRHSLRKEYGMVLQDTWLKTGTVMENVKLGKPEATDEEAVEACKAAHAHSFIKRLKNGYNTVLEENGEGLSQGQKQLLSIARIMLSMPPMLILDEATSSIDTRTELKIQEAFGRLTQGKTGFIVAHRLSTVREADVILVMNQGKVVECGSHGELMEKGGFYRELYLAGKSQLSE